MSLKAKLATTIAALCMVICLLTVGVFAASTGTMNFNGSVGITVDDVNVKVTAQVTGSEGTGEGYTSEKTMWDITTSSTTTALVPNWDDIDFNFADVTSEVVLTIKVENRSTAAAVESEFTATVAGQEVTATEYTQVGTTNIMAKIVAPTSVAKETTGTFSLSLKLKDQNAGVDTAEVSAQLVLTDERA